MDVLNPLLLLFHSAIGILGIGFLIGFHELGHFLFCKLFGIRTPSFSIGFGPTIFSKKIGGTTFILAPIPLGGYVEIAGAAEVGQGDQQEAHSMAPDSFAVKPYWQKLLVMLGGIMFNLGFAYLTFIILFTLGLPKTHMLSPANATTVVEAVAKPSQLNPGDQIIAINGKSIDDNARTLISQIRELPNKNVSLTIVRNGKTETITGFVQGREIPSISGLLYNGLVKLINLPLRIVNLFGTELALPEYHPMVGTLNVLFQTQAMPPASLTTAIREGIALTNHYIYAIASSFAHLFQTRDVSGVGGPLMVLAQTAKGAAQGSSIFFILLAIISINLAILNMIPLPILDGGQLLFYTIEAIIKRPIPVRIKEAIHIGSWLIILALILYVSLYDLLKIGEPYIEALKKFLGLIPT